MAYVDWVFYRESFLGEVVPEEAFAGVAARASRVLDMLTFGRIDRTYRSCRDVKMACCAVCEVLYTAGDAEIRRERLDAYEVERAEGPGIKRRCLDAARVYLWRTGLLSMAVAYG